MCLEKLGDTVTQYARMWQPQHVHLLIYQAIAWLAYPCAIRNIDIQMAVMVYTMQIVLHNVMIRFALLHQEHGNMRLR